MHRCFSLDERGKSKVSFLPSGPSTTNLSSSLWHLKYPYTALGSNNFSERILCFHSSNNFSCSSSDSLADLPRTPQDRTNRDFLFMNFHMLFRSISFGSSLNAVFILGGIGGVTGIIPL